MALRQFVSRNPINNQIIQTFNFLTQKELNQKIENSHEAFIRFRNQSNSDKAKKIQKLSDLIEANVEKYAKLITTEMGKPLAQSTAEVKKSAAYCRYYADNVDKYLKPQRIGTEATESYVKYEPIGSVYVIAPFNFPFWLCFKPIIPQLILGNSIIQRPSDSTPLVGMALHELFEAAGFDAGQFQNVYTSPDQIQQILGDQRIQGVSFTGSTKAGKIIAGVAGSHLKRSVMELGGMDPFLVLRDAKVHLAVELAIKSRASNCGQVCFSAKRFIIHQDNFQAFKQLLIEKLQQIKVGDPSQNDIAMGPLARRDLLENLNQQIQRGIKEGGKLLLGGEPISKTESEGNFYPPTVVECDKSNSLTNEETFGPLFTLIQAQDDQEIITLANATQYGLGAVVVSQDKDIKKVVNQIESGMVFVNEIVKSDQRLPSGGIKESGFGRECGEWGIQNFANIKTVWIQ